MGTLNKMDDAELLAELAGGSEAAFEALFRRFYPSLCYFTEQILKDRHADCIYDLTG